MTKIKSHFLGTGDQNNLNPSYIGASLGFMTADTRKGLGEASALLNVIKLQINKPHVAAYVARFDQTEPAMAVTASVNKPGASGKM